MDVNIKQALQIVERKAANRRDYQDANICVAVEGYIDELERQVADLKQDLIDLGEESNDKPPTITERFDGSAAGVS